MKAKVTCERGMTINTGNYENVRVSVGITLECDADHIDETWLRAEAFVLGKLGEEGALIRGSCDG